MPLPLPLSSSTLSHLSFMLPRVRCKFLWPISPLPTSRQLCAPCRRQPWPLRPCPQWHPPGLYMEICSLLLQLNTAVASGNPYSFQLLSSDGRILFWIFGTFNLLLLPCHNHVFSASPEQPRWRWRLCWRWLHVTAAEPRHLPLHKWKANRLRY